MEYTSLRIGQCSVFDSEISDLANYVIDFNSINVFAYLIRYIFFMNII